MSTKSIDGKIRTYILKAMAMHHPAGDFDKTDIAIADKYTEEVCDLIKQSQLDILERVDGIVNGMYELSITDLELRQHQQGVEIPVLSKTELSEALKRIKEGLDTNVQNNS